MQNKTVKRSEAVATTENGQRKQRREKKEEQSRGRQQKPLQRAWEKDKPDDVGFDPLHAHLPR